jgi:hypothetical protein
VSHTRSTPVAAAAGLLAGLGLAALPLWRQQRRAQAWRHLANHDDLTGLPNRRALHQHLRRRLAGPHPTGLIIIDLDRFKDVNDSLGHAAGNTLVALVNLPPAPASPQSAADGG